MVNPYANIQIHRSSISFTKKCLWSAASLAEPGVPPDPWVSRGGEKPPPAAPVPTSPFDRVQAAADVSSERVLLGRELINASADGGRAIR